MQVSDYQKVYPLLKFHKELKSKIAVGKQIKKTTIRLGEKRNLKLGPCTLLFFNKKTLNVDSTYYGTIKRIEFITGQQIINSDEIYKLEGYESVSQLVDVIMTIYDIDSIEDFNSSKFTLVYFERDCQGVNMKSRNVQ